MNSKSEQILKILDTVQGDEINEILAEVVKEYDLDVASNIIKSGWDNISKSWFGDMIFDEGREGAGCVRLRQLLNILEEIINTEGDDYCHGDIKLGNPLRVATDDEHEENGWSKNVEWMVEDKTMDIDKIILQFEVE